MPTRNEVPGSRGVAHDGVAFVAAGLRPRAAPAFADGLILENDDGELLAAVLMTPEEIKDWHFIMGDRPHTNWFLASDFHTGTLYSVAPDGTLFDLRHQKVGPFTTAELASRDEWILLCDGCGVHSFGGPIRHLPACSGPSARSLAPRTRARKRLPGVP